MKTIRIVSAGVVTMALLALTAPSAVADSPPAAATLLSPADEARFLTGAVTFTWAPAMDDVGIAKYELYVNGVRLATTTPAVTAFTATGLQDGTLMPWRVVAWDTAGNRTPSARRYLSINAKPPVLKAGSVPAWEWDGCCTTEVGFVWDQVDLNGLVRTHLNCGGDPDMFRPRRSTCSVESPGADIDPIATRLWVSVNDGPWTRYYDQGGVSWSSPAGWFMLPGNRYRIRTQAVDQDGRESNVITGTTYHSVRAVQDTSAAIIYSGPWTKKLSTIDTKHYGGSHKVTTVKGASATLTFTGKGVVWVFNWDGPAGGDASVYVDGALWLSDLERHAECSGEDCAGPRTVLRPLYWGKTGTHTIKVVNNATPDRPQVSVDAFMVLK